MKRIAAMFLFVMIGYAPMATAQAKSKKAGNTRSKEAVRAGTGEQSTNASNDTVSLRSVGANQAYSAADEGRLSIADPTINALKEQATGNTTVVSPSGIVGMPKGAYGFYNGKVLLRKTTALSSGTQYGSGAVGTGTSIMGVGTGENAIGVNGKNPYAGTSLWGSRIPNRNLPLADTMRRR